jgi:predicted nucleotidyltransferase/DNA-binding XRE family transcriptional regulator
VGGQIPQDQASLIDDPLSSSTVRQPQTAAELLREARQRAGLSQRELAARAAVAQSVISAYESGRRRPALETLQRLIRATGTHMIVGLLPDSGRAPFSGELGRRVRRHRDDIVRIAAAHGASNVRIFGSVARGEERPGSDLDVLIDLEPSSGLFTLMRLERDLEALLGVDVDVIPADSIKPGARADAERDLVAL